MEDTDNSWRDIERQLKRCFPDRRYTREESILGELESVFSEFHDELIPEGIRREVRHPEYYFEIISDIYINNNLRNISNALITEGYIGVFMPPFETNNNHIYVSNKPIDTRTIYVLMTLPGVASIGSK